MSTKMNILKYQYILFNTIVLWVCFCESKVSRVVGGDEAAPYFGRYHASLQNLNGEHVCGGGIVSKRHIVTAAHCLFNAHPEYIKIIVGTTNLDKDGRKYETDSFVIHDDFNVNTKTNDIAIIKSKNNFDCQLVDILPFSETKLQTNELVTVAGFGANKPNDLSNPIMQVVIMPVFDQETCKYAMRYTRNVTESMFCTFTNIGQGTCHGDSGTPLIRNGEIVGLVSWGIPCAIGFPDVHTRISPYVGWLRKQINM